jgi:hypothetical protein
MRDPAPVVRVRRDGQAVELHGRVREALDLGRRNWLLRRSDLHLELGTEARCLLVRVQRPHHPHELVRLAVPLLPLGCLAVLLKLHRRFNAQHERAEREHLTELCGEPCRNDRHLCLPLLVWPFTDH